MIAKSLTTIHPRCPRRRRSDRVKLATSAFGPQRTWAGAPHMSAFGCKADMQYVE
jgi:hypothetical protein